MKKNIPYASKASIVILLLLVSSFRSSSQNLDITILRDINLRRNKSLQGAMVGITNSVYPASGIIPVAELITGYARHDENMVANGWQIVAGVGINTIITFGLKYAMGRKRPYVTYPGLQPYQHDADPSFPSGHTSFSFNTATSLSLCYPRWYVVVPAYLWAASVGYSRMYLGMHYPSDVLAGAIIGAGSSWLACKGNKWLQHKKNKPHAAQAE